jgi:hypothetical protein
MANSSRNYKVIADPIKRVLNARSRLDNTVQIGMPFVKATTTVDMGGLLDGYNGCVGFTLGVHAYAPDIAAQDIYSPTGGTWLGYTYTEDGNTRPVYTTDQSDLLFINEMFNSAGPRAGESSQQTSVPPPGITGVTIGRNKNGLLASAQIKFSVPTLEQLEFLHRTFLIPGVGMVLEWGQQFASEKPPSEVNFTEEGEYGLNQANLGGIEGSTNIGGFLFPWLKRDILNEYLNKLGNRTFGLEEILKNHVYPTQGQYMWMFGRVGNFHVNTNSDGSYECSVKIVGPSEDAFAYTTRNTVIPRVDYVGNAKPTTVPCAINESIDRYFSSVGDGKNSSFHKLLQKMDNIRKGKDPTLSPWKGHVIKIDEGNKGSTEDNASKTGESSEETFGDYKDAYFMTWRFFVNVVLNEDLTAVGRQLRGEPNSDFPTAYGVLRGAVQDANIPLNILRPYKTAQLDNMGGIGPINDPYEQPIGCNRFLRSADPRTLIIVNKKAVELFPQNFSNSGLVGNALNADKDTAEKFEKFGDFYNTKLPGDLEDTGRLSTGVWINHKAIVECMTAGDTVLRGVSMLLDRMNAATRGFWQLTIDVSEPEVPDSANFIDEREFSYTVVDLNHRQNGEQATQEFIEKVHTFNKYIRGRNGNFVGSDVLESNVTLDLPKRLFSQIATMGLVQQSDIDAVVSGEDSGQPVILGNDANNTLARLFAITTISTKNTSGRSIDRSIPLPQKTGGLCQPSQVDKGQLQSNIQSIKTFDDPRVIRQLTLSPQEKTAADVSAASNILYKNGNQSEGLTDQCKPCEDEINKILSAPRPRPLVAAKGPQPQEGRLASRALWDAGYQNGNLPSNLLKSIGGGLQLQSQVADDFAKLNEKVRQELGYGITVNSAYRTAQRQADIVASGNQNAAAPGSSPHGWGTAVDINATPELSTWVKSNSSTILNTYGFKETYTPVGTVNYIHLEYVKRIQVSPAPTQLPPSQPDSNLSISTAPLTGTPVNPLDSAQLTSQQCIPCIQAAKQLKQVITKQEDANLQKTANDTAVRLFEHLAKIYKYIELLPDLMVANIALTSDGNSSNAFGAAPGTLSIAADLVLPGINGLRVGELFWIDRIPLFYRAFGAFQVLSIEDNISQEGWTTRIHSRFNYLGKAWKDAMAQRIALGLNSEQE